MVTFGKFLLNVTLLLLSLNGFSQKPLLDTGMFESWPRERSPSISRDGNYFSYSIEDGRPGVTTIFICSTRNDWKTSFSSSKQYSFQFTPSGKYAGFISGTDSLTLITLGTSNVTCLPNISSFSFLEASNTDALVFREKEDQFTLFFSSVNLKKIDTLKDISGYYIYNSERSLLLRRNSRTGVELYDFDLSMRKMRFIWDGGKLLDVASIDGKPEILFVGSLDKDKSSAIWKYDHNLSRLNELINESQLRSGSNITELIASPKVCSEIILFKIIGSHEQNEEPRINDVVVWNYASKRLPTKQFHPDYKEVACLYRGKLIYLSDKTGKNWNIIASHGDKLLLGESDPYANASEGPWADAAKNKLYLIDLSKGTRRPIYSEYAFISPDGKYVVYYDETKMNFFSLNIQSGQLANLTSGLRTVWSSFYNDDNPRSRIIPRGIAYLPKRGESLYIYDRFDIWRIDPSNVERPRCITRGYGAAHNTIFSICFSEGGPVLKDADGLLLSSFDVKTKNNGFFIYRRNGGIAKLFTGPYLFEVPNNPYLPDGSSFDIVKAKTSNTFIVRRMKVSESPTFFMTYDFKEFKQLSFSKPERNVNWMNSELVKWALPDSTECQGILYKPENFNPTLKYPVIVHIYERQTDGLNAYIKPDWSKGAINIPWYVSNGYVVFCPDIRYKIGFPGESAATSVISGVRHISTLSYIDKDNIGIQGMSFGGYEVNYIITKCNLFKAACSAAGVSNLVSMYGAIGGDGGGIQYRFEEGQVRMGGALWSDKRSFISNSPIFKLDQVTTPLLMMHTTNDGAVPFGQAVEMFLGLRRLGAKVWLLQYNRDGNHGVWGQSSRDYTIKTKQFFDHFLRGEHKPHWLADVSKEN